jgi:hypothetical protein
MARYYVYAGIRSSSIDPWYRILADMYTEATSKEEAIEHWKAGFTAEQHAAIKDRPITCKDIHEECPQIDRFFAINAEKAHYFDGSGIGKVHAPPSEVPTSWLPK